VSSIILETLPTGRPPHGNQVFLGTETAGARCQQASESDITAPTGLFEEKEGRDLNPGGGVAVGQLVDPAQQLIAVSWRIFEGSSRPAVVAIVRELPGVRIKGVRPVGFRSAGVQDGQLNLVLRNTARCAEPTLHSYWDEYRERVIASITCGAAAVDAVDEEIGSGEPVEADDLRIAHLAVALR
jgi:hypothetical protein